ncbi:DUF1697 domain-containing protein [Rehaibacterium terrae]|jgi:uncharacterized protein (DUF1697 family)|uniref:Uncharacterized protein (DUF1697 family) n=1 Tax=Rehaibacterium terrae TaxID=1341696 RepID=A0A7W8DD16_9GAMM|nr:DUF1697 domain-containing protein [Rehaibacterium terrae]MBB5014898.1 uncharacterized protein (DUF1697 family) [Rehaibacterium terrae]
MNTWIALLRGINVGSTRSLPMKSLIALIQSLGGEDVRTYIQSGNVVFRHRDARRLAGTLRDAIARECGFAPDVLVFDAARLRAIAAANPFPEADAAPTRVHVFFLAAPATAPDLDALERHRSGSERYVLGEHAFYLHTPDGFGKSRLAERAEKALGVAATARNWRTVSKLLEMAGGD